MRQHDAKLEAHLYSKFSDFEESIGTLPGIDIPAARETLIWQILESVHRIRYVEVVQTRPISPNRANPQSNLFDPIKASILARDSGDLDEAFWLIFLFVHFGKNERSGYRLVRDVYGKLGQGGRWDWPSVSPDPSIFRDWLRASVGALRDGNTHRAFGNHRKYQSLDADKRVGTGIAVQTYVEWITGAGGHQALFGAAVDAANGDAELAFRKLYANMQSVISFGRTARFDYLTMVAKLNLAKIEADSPYMAGATGPARGARLLFGGSTTSDLSVPVVERRTKELGTFLGLSMQVMEDSLCNWQKSPEAQLAFRG